MVGKCHTLCTQIVRIPNPCEYRWEYAPERVWIFPHIFPLTLPDFDYPETSIMQKVEFDLRATVHIVKAPTVKAAVGFSAIGIADQTTMPKAALELVDSVGFLMVSVYHVLGMGNSALARIARMSDVIVFIR